MGRSALVAPASAGTQTLRSINIYNAEHLILQSYDRLALKPKYVEQIRTTFIGQLELIKNDTAVQAEALTSPKLDVERKQRKLLETHDNDATPIEMLAPERKRLDTDLAQDHRQLKSLTTGALLSTSGDR